MIIVDFIYCNKAYYYKDILVFTGTTIFNEEKLNATFLKNIRDPNRYSLKDYKNLSNKKLLDDMVIKELPKPHTFPKFNNETPFLIKFNGKTFHNPQIISIRWTGYMWEYKIKNIGHEYDYQPENTLENDNN